MPGVGGMGAMGTTGTIGLNPTMDALDPQQQFQVLTAQRAVIEAYHRTMLSFSKSRSTTSRVYDEDGHGVTSATCQWSTGGEMPWMLKIGVVYDMEIDPRTEIIVLNILVSTYIYR